jgi:hypothetical protein
VRKYRPPPSHNRRSQTHNSSQDQHLSQVRSFVLLDFPELSATELIDPSVVYIEGFAKDLYLDQEDQVTRYRDAVDRIRQAAWDTTETKEIIMAVARKYGLAI